MAAAAASLGRLARAGAWMRRGAAKVSAAARRTAAKLKASRARALANKRSRQAKKLSSLQVKTKLTTAKAQLAKEKALVKGYRRGTISPTGAALAGSAPIGMGLGAAALSGIGSAVGAGLAAAGEVAAAAMAREGQPAPDIDESSAMSAQVAPARTREERILILKLARLDARTRLRLAREQRATAREVAFLNNPVIGVGVAASMGVATYYGLHYLSEYRDSAGWQPPASAAASATILKLPAPQQPTLPNL